MKATELMIGDWVYGCTDPYSPDEEQKKFPVKVIRIDIDGDIYTMGKSPSDDPYDYEWWNIEPIPLTPEILEKNGFKYDGSGQRSMMLMTPHGVSGTRWNIYVGLKHKTIDVFSAPPVEKSPGWRKHNKVYLEVCGCYVHELQHALRLCGIDKEIVL